MQHTSASRQRDIQRWLLHNIDNPPAVFQPEPVARKLHAEDTSLLTCADTCKAVQHTHALPPKDLRQLGPSAAQDSNQQAARQDSTNPATHANYPGLLAAENWHCTLALVTTTYQLLRLSSYCWPYTCEHPLWRRWRRAWQHGDCGETLSGSGQGRLAVRWRCTSTTTVGQSQVVDLA